MAKNGPPPRPGGGGDRPSPRRPRLWVGTVSPQHSGPIRLVALNDWIHGFWTHYLVGTTSKDCRTRPCFRDSGTCEHCPLVKNRKWKGYLGAHVVGMKRPVILEITEGCWDGTPDLRRLDGELRGWQWTARRERDYVRSRMLMERAQTLIIQPVYPKVDVLAVLARMWATTVQDLLGEANVHDGDGGWGNVEGIRPDLAAQVAPPAGERQENPPLTFKELREKVEKAKARLNPKGQLPM